MSESTDVCSCQFFLIRLLSRLSLNFPATMVAIGRAFTFQPLNGQLRERLENLLVLIVHFSFGSMIVISASAP